MNIIALLILEINFSENQLIINFLRNNKTYMFLH